MKQFSIIVTTMVFFLTACNAPKSKNTIQTTEATEALANMQQAKETMTVATQFMQSMTSGDMETMISLMDDDMVWHNEGDSTIPWIGPWKGKKVILTEFLPLFMKHFATVKWETKDAISQGEIAAFFGTMEGKIIRNEQKTGKFTFALRVKVKNGKIILWNWFEDSYAVSKAFNKK